LVNPDQVAYLLPINGGEDTQVVFTGFAGGMLSLDVKGKDGEVARTLETGSAWWGFDLGKEPSRATIRLSKGDGNYEDVVVTAEEERALLEVRQAGGTFAEQMAVLSERTRVAGTVADWKQTAMLGFEAGRPISKSFVGDELRGFKATGFVDDPAMNVDSLPFAKPQTVDRRPGALNFATHDVTRPPSKRAQRRAAAKAAQTPKGKS
jgi:hypothetical protein